MRVAEVEERIVAFLGCVAGVRGRRLVGDDEVGDEEGVGDEGRAEDSAGFEIAGRVGVGEVEEGGPEVWGQQHGAKGCARFGEGGGLECVL